MSGNYTYVNGTDDYKGNILLDPDGTVTRAELYDALAEAARPVEVTITQTPAETAATVIVCGSFLVAVVIFIWACVAVARKGRA